MGGPTTGTFADRPPAFTLLHAVVILPLGGDTSWANTVTAYQSLPAELRELADRLRIVHTNAHDYAAVYGRGERVDDTLAKAQEQLLVPSSITSASQLAGKSVGVLVGSSEDYELLGYLALEHLTGKVKVVPFASEPAAGAAALSGAIDAAYVYGAPATNLISQKGYHSLVNAEQIARLGVPGLDVIAVSTKVIKTDPALVQDYVCAELKGSQDMTGPDAATYLSATAKVQGASGVTAPDS